LENFSVMGIEKEEGLVVGIKELLAMDVLKRFGPVTMWEYEFRLCHLNCWSRLVFLIYPRFTMDYNKLLAQQITTLPDLIR
jgi:hypothetical protein